MLVPVFARHPVSGYSWIVDSIVAIGFISYGPRVHHMFAEAPPVAAMPRVLGETLETDVEDVNVISTMIVPPPLTSVG